VSSASTSILFQSPATSPGTSSRKQSWQLYDDVVRLQLNPHMSMYVGSVVVAGSWAMHPA
jgi:hypothetical protein